MKKSDIIATLNSPELLEALADVEHARWSAWEKYRTAPERSEEDEKRWRRQRVTPYAELTEKEKDSDRREAKNSLAVIREALLKTKKEASMNILEHAYLAGKQAAEAKFAPVPAAKPVAKPPQSSAAPATAQAKPATKAPVSLGIAPKPSMPGMAGNAGGSASSSSQSSPAASTAIGAPQLVQQSALQMAQNTINSTGTQMLGVLPKMADFNFGITPDPSLKPDKVPKGDNNGTTFSDPDVEPTIPQDIHQAFNDLSIQKNLDIVNEWGEMGMLEP